MSTYLVESYRVTVNNNGADQDSPLSLQFRVLGLQQNVEMSDQPEEGEDGAAAAADRGVERDHPHVGLRPGAAAQDGHVLPLVLPLSLQGGVGGGRDGGVRRGCCGTVRARPRTSSASGHSPGGAEWRSVGDGDHAEMLAQVALSSPHL